MRHVPWNDDVGAIVATLRALAPPPAEVHAAAAAIVADVRVRGDDAVREQTLRLDGVALEDEYAVPAAELRARLDALAPSLRAALELGHGRTSARVGSSSIEQPSAGASARSGG